MCIQERPPKYEPELFDDELEYQLEVLPFRQRRAETQHWNLVENNANLDEELFDEYEYEDEYLNSDSDNYDTENQGAANTAEDIHDAFNRMLEEAVREHRAAIDREWEEIDAQGRTRMPPQASNPFATTISNPNIGSYIQPSNFNNGNNGDDDLRLHDPELEQFVRRVLNTEGSSPNTHSDTHSNSNVPVHINNRSTGISTAHHNTRDLSQMSYEALLDAFRRTPPGNRITVGQQAERDLLNAYSQELLDPRRRQQAHEETRGRNVSEIQELMRANSNRERERSPRARNVSEMQELMRAHRERSPRE